MIRSFEYYEYLPNSESLRNQDVLDSEMDLARQAILLSPPIGKKMCNCVGCKSDDLKLFFIKWGVEYYRCMNCGAVCANVSEENIEYYSNYQPLNEYRTSVDFQNEISDKRANSWSEFVDWVYLRSCRYLGLEKKVRIADYGNRYVGLRNSISRIRNCISYDSFISTRESSGKYDIAICNDIIQRTCDPITLVSDISQNLNKNGLLIMNLKMGAGFDILALKDKARIYPYEHIFLPTEKTMNLIFRQCGFEVLEYSVPGQMDVRYVLDNKQYIQDTDLFLKQLINHSDSRVLADFQYFLQKSGMCSFMRVVARKNHE